MSTRREFLATAVWASGGLVLGFRLGAAEAPAAGTTPSGTGPVFRPNAWLRIESDGRLVLVVGSSEMGQGVRTSLPMILAEELDADLDAVTLEQASPGPEYQDLGTGGSDSTMSAWEPLRRAGAAARAMLVAAAASRWQTDPSHCRTERSRVHEIGGQRSLGYGELAADAARLPVPAQPKLKSAAERRLLGTRRARVDGPAIVTGRARYGLDVRLPGMRYAVVARPPTLGGGLASFDAGSVRRVPGVLAALRIPSGVAIVAESTWAALRGREALKAVWDSGPDAAFSSATHFERLRRLAAEPGRTMRREGRGRAGLAAAVRQLDAFYEYPFAAHAAIEPLNCTAWLHDGRCEIWAPTQTPNAVQGRAAQALSLAPEKVEVHVTLLGGGFGRRLGWDFNLEAVEIARQVAAPVQLLWTRDDDFVHGYFQAASVHHLQAGLDAQGRLVAWDHHKVSTPHNARRKPSPEDLAEGANWSWGVYDTPYAIPDLETSYTPLEAPVPIGPWRAVFAPSSVFARESFLDEIAQAAGRDPLSLRLELLGANDPSIPAVIEPNDSRIDRRRLRRVLELAAEKAGWQTPVQAGRARGLACDVFHTETYVAYAVEVARRPGARSGGLPFRVERVVCALDCGVVVNRGGVEQQVESGVVWSLSNMKSEITFAAGRARETSYLDFPVLTIDESPPIETHVVASDDSRPHGLGEPTVSPLAPAVANALSRLVGKRIRRLPVRAADVA